MKARVLLLVVALALACARPCSPSGFAAPGARAMDVASARRVLGVLGVASAEETRAAFHRASLRAHPDKPGGSHEEFVQVTEAYEVLRHGVESESGNRASWTGGGSASGYRSQGGGAPTSDRGYVSGFTGNDHESGEGRDSSSRRSSRDEVGESPFENDRRAGNFERAENPERRAGGFSFVSRRTRRAARSPPTDRRRRRRRMVGSTRRAGFNGFVSGTFREGSDANGLGMVQARRSF
jgi:curved DNA-binding protein CbpA